MRHPQHFQNSLFTVQPSPITFSRRLARSFQKKFTLDCARLGGFTRSRGLSEPPTPPRPPKAAWEPPESPGPRGASRSFPSFLGPLKNSLPPQASWAFWRLPASPAASCNPPGPRPLQLVGLSYVIIKNRWASPNLPQSPGPSGASRK